MEKMEQRKNNPPQPENRLERRTYTVEMRVAKEGEGDTVRSVTGYAPRFNSPSEVMYLSPDERFVEYFEQNAFRSALPKSDPRALRDHIPHLILGRQSANTLNVWEDSTGLGFRFELPNTTYANDLAVSMERGDVRETSFAFTLKEDSDKWSRRADGIWERRIPADAVERIYDISVVTYPAYPDSEAQLNSQNLTVAYRSLQTATQKEDPPLPAEASAEEGQPNHRQRLLEALERAAK